MKQLLGALSIAILFAGTSHAQTSTATETLDVLDFNASILFGGRSTLEGEVNSSNGDDNVIGAYAEPKLGLSYSSDKVDVSAGYKLEAWGAKGFGDARAEQGIGENWHFMHAPNVEIIGKLNSRFNIKNYAELEHVTKTGSQDDNEFNIYIEPALTFKVNDAVTLAASYDFQRYEGVDSLASSLGDDRNAADEFRAATNSESFAAIIQSASVRPVDTLHLGKLASSVTLSDTVSLSSYVRGGRQVSNTDDGAFVYRIQNELKTQPIAPLSLKLRHRFNFTDTRNTNENGYDNRFRVIADYSLLKDLSIYGENEIKITDKTNNPDNAATYTNDSKLGLLYTF